MRSCVIWFRAFHVRREGSKAKGLARKIKTTEKDEAQVKVARTSVASDAKNKRNYAQIKRKRMHKGRVAAAQIARGT